MSSMRATGLNFASSVGEHIFPEVDVFDIREYERVTVFARLRCMDPWSCTAIRREHDEDLAGNVIALQDI
jgi:hypothetical protein